jgi:hypothetical protein
MKAASRNILILILSILVLIGLYIIYRMYFSENFEDVPPPTAADGASSDTATGSSSKKLDTKKASKDLIKGEQKTRKLVLDMLKKMVKTALDNEEKAKNEVIKATEVVTQAQKQLKDAKSVFDKAGGGGAAAKGGDAAAAEGGDSAAAGDAAGGDAEEKEDAAAPEGGAPPPT